MRRFLKSTDGSAPVISFVVLAPLFILVAFGFSWMGHLADAASIAEEAARAGARWLAAHPGEIAEAKNKAAEVIEAAEAGGFIPSQDENIYCSDPISGDPSAPSGDPARSARTDGHAYCRVEINYPVPFRNFLNMMAHAGASSWIEEPDTKKIIGEAFFRSGEAGDMP